MSEETGALTRADGVLLAYRRIAGHGPTVVFLGGFHSDMTGTKAEFLAGWCAARGQAFLRLDYSGHGASGGRFEDGCIGDWASDAEAVIRHATEGPLVLVGSSMGGWISLLLAPRLRDRVRALIGVAAAPDFTEDLMWAQFPPDVRSTIERDGAWSRPSEYGGAYPITRRLIEDGWRNLVLRGPIALDIPVRLLHGQRDPDVPWALSLRLAEKITSDDVRVILVKDGDHRLSREQDLALLAQTIEEIGR